MLNNYLIDILIMMLNIIAFYNKLVYTIINTLYKITTTSRINLRKLTILKFKVFQSTENFVGSWDITILFLCRKICKVNYNCVPQSWKVWEVNYYFVSVSKNLWGELQFCPTEPKSLRSDLQFCLTVPKILWGTPVHGQLFELCGCFSF